MQMVAFPIDLDLCQVAVVVAFRMRVEPVGIDAEKERAAGGTDVVEGFAGGFNQLERIPGVGAHGADAKGCGAGLNVPSQGELLRGALRVEIVLKQDQ